MTVKVFLDTSVLVAAVVDNHDAHARAFAVLTRIHDGKDEGFVSAHSVAEMFAVLTRLPPPFRHTPEQALLSIEENVVKHFTLQALSGNDYISLVREAALAGVQGGMIYDAVLLRGAAKAGVDRIYTLNLRHFQALAPPSLVSLLSIP